jgi:DUF438 domain-containing protein
MKAKGKAMSPEKDYHLENIQLVALLDKIPVGVTVIDLEGRILYYNEYSSQIVDRKPEYIGEDIRACHKNPDSILKINRILEELKEDGTNSYYYESERNGKTLGVTVLPYKANDKLIGFIQSFIVKR